MFIFQVLTVINQKVAEATAEVFSRFYEQYMPKIFRYISFRISDQNLAEDLTSVVFEKALTKFNSYDSEKANFSTWVFSIARHTLIDHFRSNHGSQMVPLDSSFAANLESSSPEEEAVKSEECRILRQCITRLASNEREIISLKFGAEMTNRQIAQTLGLSESNVGVILYRAVRKLKDKFNE